MVNLQDNKVKRETTDNGKDLETIFQRMIVSDGLGSKKAKLDDRENYMFALLLK